jgi:hypothetical protein
MKLIEKMADEYSREAVESHNSRPADSYRDYMAGFRKAREMFLERFGDLEAGNRYEQMAYLGEEEA